MLLCEIIIDDSGFIESKRKILKSINLVALAFEDETEIVSTMRVFKLATFIFYIEQKHT